MRRFLINVLGFIIPLFVLLFTVDPVISKILKHGENISAEYEVWNDIYESKIKCDVAVYGSSRAWVHFDPQIISDSLNIPVYNFGIDGQNFWIQYLRHIEFIEKNKKPKAILVSLDITTFEKNKDLYNLQQFLPYMLWNDNLAAYTESFNGFDKIDYYIPGVRYFGKSSSLKTCIKVLLYGRSEKVRNLGYKGQKREWTEEFKNAKNYRRNRFIEIDSASVILFDKFVSECKESGIEVVLVYSPEYIDAKSFISNRQEVMGLFRKISKKHDLRFLDYSEDTMCTERDLFYNSQHLNIGGSAMFSSKLGRDLRKIQRVFVRDY